MLFCAVPLPLTPNPCPGLAWPALPCPDLAFASPHCVVWICKRLHPTFAHLLMSRSLRQIRHQKYSLLIRLDPLFGSLIGTATTPLAVNRSAATVAVAAAAAAAAAAASSLDHILASEQHRH
ncbi:hypothetical protein TcWFU_009568 [Taenia crassiceps]|uniref:Secreted protein n=1 Tax=Taenia crassiceps TaxID=6207 RepID=A0ABR4Q278_9CEST